MTNHLCHFASTDDGLSCISLHRLPFDYDVSSYTLTKFFVVLSRRFFNLLFGRPPT